MNLRIWANRTLNVLRMRTSTSGAMSPSREPNAIAIRTFGNSPSFIFFIYSVTLQITEPTPLILRESPPETFLTESALGSP